MKGKIKIAAIFLLCLVQIAAIFSSIWQYERVLHKGQRYLFEVCPADPYDPWRGRYVTLHFRQYKFDINKAGEFYVTFTHNERGIAKADMLSQKPPNHAQYLKVHIDEKGRVQLPFERFYMEEESAKFTDIWVNQGGRVQCDVDGVGTSALLAEVYIFKGRGVISELFYQGERLKEVIKREMKR